MPNAAVRPPIATMKSCTGCGRLLNASAIFPRKSITGSSASMIVLPIGANESFNSAIFPFNSCNGVVESSFIFCADPLTSSNVCLTSVKDWTTFIALSSPSADQIVEALFNWSY